MYIFYEILVNIKFPRVHVELKTKQRKTFWC